MTIALPRLDRSTAADRGITIGDFLVPIRIAERLGPRVRHIALIVAGALFVALCAQVTIPTQPVPFTAQTFGVLVVGGALGLRRGALALALYLLIGSVGLPVFASGRHGLDVVTGVTGGYLVAFIIAAGIVGRLAELGWDRHIGGSVGAMLIGTVLIYAVGVPWLKLATSMPWSEAMTSGMLQFVAWDLAKAVVAGAIFPLAWWRIDQRPDDR